MDRNLSVKIDCAGLIDENKVTFFFDFVHNLLQRAVFHTECDWLRLRPAGIASDHHQQQHRQPTHREG